MQLNTLYQLISMQRARSPLLEQAETLLLMPDLFNFWLTGVKTTEFSIASTTQFVDPRTRSWATDLLDQFGLPSKILTDIVPTAASIGPLRPDIASEAGCGPIQVLAPGEHDTASAIVAVPASTLDYAYISSGTWSLMGIETTEPRISHATRAYNFTNEGGACGTIRLLKNIMGLWLVQECRRAETRRGKEYTYAQLSEMAAQAAPFQSLIEPDSPEFLAPDDMLAAIAEFCRRTGQSPPADLGATIRCCLESLALKYRWALERLEEFRGKAIDVIHIVGGGTQNRLLCQLAADATGRTVIAGPVEATATGNVLMQALGRGHIGSLDQAREIVRRSFPLETYSSSSSRDRWQDAYARFLDLRDRIGKVD
jgi:rhamnulokinase